MQAPPILTAREQEILPFLVSGATRDEIASTLDVSAETVKWHTRQILKKFDCRSVTDGFQRMREYVNIYSDEGLGFKYFIDHYVSIVEMTENRIDCKQRRDWSVTVVRDGNIVFKHLQTTDGTTRNAMVDGVPVEAVNIFERTSTFERTVVENASQGFEFESTYKCDMIGVYPANIETHSSRIIQPVGSLCIRVQFPNGQDPFKVWGLQTLNWKPVERQEFDFIYENGCAELRVENAEFQNRYTVNWQWAA